MKNLFKGLFFTCLLASCFYSAAFAVEAPIAVDSRIKTYIYNPTEVFPVVLHYGYSTHIDLRPKETVRDIIMGDSSVWTIDVKGNRVFIRANEIGAHTNMTLITSLDVYELDLFSRSAEDGVDLDMAYVIRFFHPPTPAELEALLGEGASVPPIFKVDANTKPSFGVGEFLSTDLSYNFKSTGDADIMPTVVLTDGKVTYMKFPNTKSKLPRIYEVSGDSNKLLDMVEYNGYIILNSTASKFILRRDKLTVNVIKQN